MILKVLKKYTVIMLNNKILHCYKVSNINIYIHKFFKVFRKKEFFFQLAAKNKDPREHITDLGG